MAILGIDLGTTNSACAIWNDDSVEFIPNRLGEYLTPSVVGVDSDGKIIVGKIAKERLIKHSDKSVAVFKRLMGTKHKIKVGKSEFSATELSALLLKSLKEDAESHLGEEITEAVISVPAYFNDNQRHATKAAGEIAGLRVNRIINEPTAAAIAYGLHEKQDSTFLILDMGGGTFDVSILEFFDGVMEVHASAGDNFLGGEDFLENMVKSFLEANQLNKEQLSAKESQNLYMQMETAKRQIDKLETTEIFIEVGGSPVNWQMTSDWFKRTCTPLLLKAKAPIQRALSDSNLSLAEIDDVILVGGATRMPLFRNMIGKLFARFPSCNLDPDLVVTMGAAIQGGLIDRNEALDDIVLTDVCPYTLGTEVASMDGSGGEGGYFLPIIERNSVVPISIVRQVETAQDNQREVVINIYQGEHRLVAKNIFLGNLRLKIPKNKAGEEKIDIRYSYDMNGLLEVEATVCSTQKKVSALIEHSQGLLSKDDKKKSLQKLSALKFHPREHEENRVLIARGERIYESSIGDKRDFVSKLLADFDRILEKQQPLEIKKASVQLKQALEELDTEEWT